MDMATGGEPNRRSDSNSDVDPTNLYMNNIPKDYTEEHLRVFLEGKFHCKVVSARILRHKETHESLAKAMVRIRSSAAELSDADICKTMCDQLNDKVSLPPLSPTAAQAHPLQVKLARRN